MSLGQPVFNQNIGLQQQLIPQMGLQQPMYPLAVQYPTSRPMNTIAFQNQPQAQSSPQIAPNSSKFNPNQRLFSGTGHVTKVQNDFGFIDEEVFFHKNVCKGLFPKVGDRVLVEAQYNQNMPFKWNATRVQVLQSATTASTNSSSSSRHASTYGTNQSSTSDRSGRSRYSPTRKSPERHSHRSSNHDSRQREIDDDDRRRRRDDRDSERYRDKRDRSPERDRRDRDRSPLRKLSPKRRKVRPIPRYMVQMPKQQLTLKTADILELRRRYHTLYIPSDFFLSGISWVDAFPPNMPFSIRKPCAFHVMHKDVEPLQQNDSPPEPADADYLYSAKVMLMSTPAMTDFYQKCFATAEERDRYDDERDFVHPTRLINFLVGIRGKNETMAIGGPWSPSADGEDPQSNPNVLIKTAIRTCKGLTGIDLSNCSRWYRFVELFYRRSETYHKGRLIPARIETVVIFLPDVRSCQPTTQEWEELHLSYKSHLERIISIQNSESPVLVDSSSTATDGKEQPTSTDGDKAAVPVSSDIKADAEVKVNPEENSKEKSDSSTSIDNDGKEAANETNAAEDNDKGNTEEDVEKETTELTVEEVKKLKVAELKTELQARNLPTDGVKNVLVTRLIKALEEKEEETNKKGASETKENDNKMDDDNKKDEDDDVQITEPAADKDDEEFETMDNVDMSEVTVIDEYDSTKPEEKTDETAKKQERAKLTEKERLLLEKRYSLPEQPHIIVHPSRIAKSGKFDCAVMSLSVLLDYRPEDSKEHSFEVSLFAELFNEMLTRDFGFNIYKAICMLPTKKDEETKKEVIVVDDSKENEEKKLNGDGTKDKEKEGEVETKTKDDKDDKEKERARDKDREVRKKSRFDDTSDDDRRRREKEKEKLYTVDRELLLSFVYFDVSHCGYIFDKDVEDLFYTIGLNLSRSQIRRVVSKAITRDSLYYRKLTDKVKEPAVDEEKENEKEEATEGDKTGTVKEEDSIVVPKVEQQEKENELTEEELQDIATGNNNYTEQLLKSLELVLKSEATDEQPAKKIKLDPVQDKNNIPQTNNGLVMYNGGVIDVSKLLEQMQQAEKSRENIEQSVVDLRRQNADLLKSNTRATEKIKDQSADIKSLARKLIDAEQNLRETTKKSNEYFSTLSNVYDRVSVVIHRSESKRSSSITSSKRGSSRDRSNRRDRKSKEKDAEQLKDGSEKQKLDEKVNDESSEVVIIINESKETADNKKSESEKTEIVKEQEVKNTSNDEKKE